MNKSSKKTRVDKNSEKYEEIIDFIKKVFFHLESRRNLAETKIEASSTEWEIVYREITFKI